MSRSIFINSILFKVKHQFDNILLLTPENMPKGISIPFIAQTIWKNKSERIIDIIGTEDELAIILKDKNDIPVDELFKTPILSNNTRKLKLPVYVGCDNDWTEITRYTGLSKKEYLVLLIQSKFKVEMYGFILGFLYITGLNERLHCPRKTKPNMLTHENTMAIGGKYLGFYSQKSPAGWNVIGHAAVDILNIPNVPPYLLDIGDELTIELISKEEYHALIEQKTTILSYNGID